LQLLALVAAPTFFNIYESIMSRDSIEKENVAHTEYPAKAQADHDEISGFDADESTLPEGYFHSRFFIGTYLAIAFGLWAGTAAL